MIGIVLKHYIYDAGISAMLDTLISNFQVYVPNIYLDGYWTALDPDDGTIVAWGKCIQEEGDLIVLDDGDGEYVVHIDLYNINLVNEQTCKILGDDSLDSQSMIQYLNDLDDGHTYS